MYSGAKLKITILMALSVILLALPVLAVSFSDDFESDLSSWTKICQHYGYDGSTYSWIPDAKISTSKSYSGQSSVFMSSQLVHKSYIYGTTEGAPPKDPYIKVNGCVYKSLSTSATGMHNLEVYFYDSMETRFSPPVGWWGLYFGVRLNPSYDCTDYGSGIPEAMECEPKGGFFVGFDDNMNTGSQYTHYEVNDVKTSVARTAGWHKLEFNLMTDGTNHLVAKIDGTIVFDGASSVSSLSTLALVGKGTNVYFDDLKLSPPLQCSDGTDNDNDGWTDYPEDPGCSAATDDDESDNPACSDGIDNDDDTYIDYPDDPGCDDKYDTDEFNLILKKQCEDGIDNDNDSRIDYPYDPGCSSALDDDESDDPACADGIDNDNDSWVDYPEDPGCSAQTDVDESDNPSCSDGIDNDDDTYIDYPYDPGCVDKYDTDEYNALALKQCEDGLDNDNDTLVDYPDDPACSSSDDDNESDDPACADKIDNDNDGWSDYPQDPGCSSLIDDDESDDPECSDDLDNDGDGLADYPNDPGCDDRYDTNESNEPIMKQCEDGLDNDGDGFVDYPDDPACASATGNDESADPACADGLDNDGDGLIDLLDPGCVDKFDTDEYNEPMITRELFFDTQTWDILVDGKAYDSMECYVKGKNGKGAFLCEKIIEVLDENIKKLEKRNSKGAKIAKSYLSDIRKRFTDMGKDGKCQLAEDEFDKVISDNRYKSLKTLLKRMKNIFMQRYKTDCKTYLLDYDGLIVEHSKDKKQIKATIVENDGEDVSSNAILYDLKFTGKRLRFYQILKVGKELVSVSYEFRSKVSTIIVDGKKEMKPGFVKLIVTTEKDKVGYRFEDSSFKMQSFTPTGWVINNGDPVSIFFYEFYYDIFNDDETDHLDEI
ncbi:hypothetical protein COV93_03210 [Candidatus Woesearchaeota archaeon CG11_big_fil_rev_8_21_14_0_20_43_8]|nr:MAG: hypothetical protein COV93_03210 [Candidatus Woesearchaeota archaeon CG11_big_fil_rev_8_21_14_0_20_43_8]PIO09006.1 MAG: hypothetical protein COT47_00265 [Candidatus Woesearchaeota archaeon CG08_land_8_20_14_0_20_43_7]